MLTSERRKAIAEIVKRESAVTTTALLQIFDVSTETIRKDLLYLEDKGLLSRVHGGAVSRNRVMPFRDFEKRLDEHRAEKRELSVLAASLVSEGDIIGIDAGTTAIEFVDELMRRFQELTIVTYSMDVFERVHDFKNFNIILCGGTYLNKERTFYGSFTRKMLEGINLRKSFVFPSAISLKKGVCDYQPQILELQTTLIENSDQVIILADSSKWEKSALYRICDVSDRYVFVTDSGLPDSIKQLYLENQCKILTKAEDLQLEVRKQNTADHNR